MSASMSPGGRTAPWMAVGVGMVGLALVGALWLARSPRPAPALEATRPNGAPLLDAQQPTEFETATFGLG